MIGFVLKAVMLIVAILVISVVMVPSLAVISRPGPCQSLIEQYGNDNVLYRSGGCYMRTSAGIWVAIVLPVRTLDEH